MSGFSLTVPLIVSACIDIVHILPPVVKLVGVFKENLTDSHALRSCAG